MFCCAVEDNLSQLIVSLSYTELKHEERSTTEFKLTLSDFSTTIKNSSVPVTSDDQTSK